MNTTELGDHSSGEGWHLDASGRPARWWLWLLGAAMFFGMGAVTAGYGWWGAATLLALIGSGFLFRLLLRPRKPMPARRYDGPEGSGLLFPVFAMRPSFVLAFAIFGWLMLGGGTWVGFQAIAEGEPWLLVATALGVVVGLLSLAAAWYGARSRLQKSNGVLLTPSEVSVIFQAEPATVSWEAITEVRAHWTRLQHHGADSVRNWLTFVVPGHAGPNPYAPFARTNSPTVNADDLGVPPRTVLAVSRYYLEHPGARSELATRNALHRVQQFDEGP